MALTNKPSVTTLQVGNTGYYLRGKVPTKGVIEYTKSVMTENPVNTPVEKVEYKFKNDTEWYKSTDVYSSEAAFKTALDAKIDALP